MEWIVWITLFAFILTVLLFTMLYSFSDIECVWPPCVSELIEQHKSLTLLMFGFTTGMVWLNLIILSIVVRIDELTGVATVMFFSVLGVFAFDLCEHRPAHYLSVLMYTITSTTYANVVVSDKLVLFTVAVDVFTVLFMGIVVFTAFDQRWHQVSKCVYTSLECCWILSFCVYAIAHAFENRLFYNSLFLVLDCAPSTPHEKGLHDILTTVVQHGSAQHHPVG
jgi:hypothetical protein